MSKIGQQPIPVPASVQISIDGNGVTVTGKLGNIAFTVPNGLKVEKTGETLRVTRKDDTKKLKSLHGLYRNLISNAVKGVEDPWQKRLEVVGTGYNVKLQGEDLVFKVGYSHNVVFKKVSGVSYQVEGNNKVVVSGVDRQFVGQIAYQIKIIKKPDAYKGKGIRYEGERLRIKPGKKAKTTA